jgi:bifunctional non-homologous end joining protein LigD
VCGQANIEPIERLSDAVRGASSIIAASNGDASCKDRAAGLMPAARPKIVPLIVKRRAAAFDNDGWLFELKYDGFRALLEIDSAGARLVSRNRTSTH